VRENSARRNFRIVDLIPEVDGEKRVAPLQTSGAKYEVNVQRRAFNHYELEILKPNDGESDRIVLIQKIPNLAALFDTLEGIESIVEPPEKKPSK
jgi:hypothetical protein